MASKPKPPADLDATATKLWTETHAALLAQGTWKDHDHQLLTDYVRLKQMAREAWAGLPRVKKGRKFVPVMTITGSMGQDVQHPNLRTKRQAENDALEIARELLIPPRARQRARVGAAGGGSEAGGQNDPFAGAF